jgi:antitoxin component HigA of HigAB toxin-antitoxin module
MTKIENEVQYAWAERRVEELLPLVNDSTPTDDPNYIELVLLSNLVADYSEEHYALGEPSLVDVIKLRMYEMGLTKAKLRDWMDGLDCACCAHCNSADKKRFCVECSGTSLWEPSDIMLEHIAKEIDDLYKKNNNSF